MNDSASPSLPDSVEAAMSKAIEPVLAKAAETRPRLDMTASPPPPPALAPAQKRAQNRVYDHMVEGGDDVIGLVAYALYKQDKRDWLVAWRKQRDSEPGESEVEAFVAAQMSAAQRERYRAGARQVLDAYALVAVDVEKPQIMKDAIAGRIDAAARRVEASARWARQIPAAFLGGIIAALAIAGIIAILVAADVDVAGYLGVEAAVETGEPANVTP